MESPAAPASSVVSMFTPVTPGRASSMIVDQILTLMRTQQLKAGDRLPPERELCQMLGAARATMREALRVLESRGLLKIRVGAKGGAFVTVPSNDRAAQGFVDVLVAQGMTSADVTEARSVLEIGVIPLICERATPEDIEDLRQLCKRDRAALEADAYEIAYSVEFHLRLITSAHNPAVDMLAATLREGLRASLETTQNVPGTTIYREFGLVEHEQLVEAIADGRVDEAITLIRTHLKRTSDRTVLS